MSDNPLGHFILTRLEVDDVFRAHDADSKQSAQSKGPSLTITEYSPARIVARAVATDEHSRRGGMVSGGVIFWFFDALGYMVTLAQSPHGTEALTSDVSIKFLRPGPVGPFVVEGVPLRFGRRSSVVGITISSPLISDGPVASGIITFFPIFPSDGQPDKT